MCVRPPASAGLPPREQTVAVVVDVANLHIALSRHLSFSTLHLDQLLDTLLGQIGWLALQTGGLCGQPDPCGKRLAKKCKMVHGSASRGRFLKQQFFTVLRCLFVCLFADLKSKVFIFDFPAHWVVPLLSSTTQFVEAPRMPSPPPSRGRPAHWANASDVPCGSVTEPNLRCVEVCAVDGQPDEAQGLIEGGEGGGIQEGQWQCNKPTFLLALD